MSSALKTTNVKQMGLFPLTIPYQISVWYRQHKNHKQISLSVLTIPCQISGIRYGVVDAKKIHLVRVYVGDDTIPDE